MAKALVLSAVRTPVGRYGGGLAGVRPDDLAAAAIQAAVERARIDPAEIEDVYLGCANQAGEDNRNVARMAALLAGLPESVAGVTVNRLCASGLSAVVGACHAIAAGDGELFVAGGVESMSRAPLVTPKPEAAYPRGDRPLYDTTLGWRFPNPKLEERFPLETMGETGENVAERWDVSREEQDAFALRSQQRWAAADFADELVPVAELERDEHPRPDTSAEKLASLKPAFRAGGTVTAGNSSGLNDGAAALVIASEEKARALGAEPLGTFVASAVAGVDPRVMGIGPVPAVRKLLDRAGLTAADLDLVELNEAFASQSLAVIRDLGLDEEKVNVNGGAIAIGHPLGMSGARLVVTLLHELRRRGGRYGVATMCVGVASGKGGVGKSTLTLNLALALRARGAAVGVLDADLYGPDIPLMVGLKRTERARELKLWRLGRQISLPPVEVHGLRLMSVGFLIGEDQALALPSPSVELVLRQLVYETDWGELDYLLVDLPPGTADVQQQIVRMLRLDAAILVVGPQDVSHLDAKRVLELFADSGTRVLGAVENMAALVCPHCGETVSVFGEVPEERSLWALGVERLASIPLDPAVASREPVLLSAPESAPGRAFAALAEDVAAALP